jgi:hypothetical protein
MSDEQTQKTKPKKGKPIDIPIPARSQIERDFLKIAHPANKDDSAAQGDDEDE